MPKLFNIAVGDGITEYNEEDLARDPSLIVGYPYPPGESSFYVDAVQQIRAGCRIFYSTTAENDPVQIARESAELYRARKEVQAHHPDSKAFAYWQGEIERLQASLAAYHQGRKRIKSVRQVVYVDPARNLIVVNAAFKHGYKPRVMGSVVRIVGETEDLINEVATDILHKEAKKRYGTYDWESEYNSTGKFPALRAG